MKQRVITAVIAAALFLPVIMIGGWPLLLLAMAMTGAAVAEALKMKQLSFLSAPGLLSVLLACTFLIPEKGGVILGLTQVEWLAVFVLLFLAYTVVTKNQFTFEDASFCTLISLYIGFGFSYMVETREAGVVFVFFALLLTWATDSGAYFVGRAIGKRKLWPDISPNKTVAGFYGGIACAVATAAIFLMIADFKAPALWVLAASAILSVAGQLGDLAESALKRHFGVKDSGNLLPGHGGVLDRTDSWLFVFPLLHFLQLL